jgi:hypothetical protein
MVGAVAGAVVAEESVAIGAELVAAAVDSVIIPLGPNTMAEPEDVVTAPEVSPVVGTVVAGG